MGDRPAAIGTPIADRSAPIYHQPQG